MSLIYQFYFKVFLSAIGIAISILYLYNGYSILDKNKINFEDVKINFNKLDKKEVKKIEKIILPENKKDTSLEEKIVDEREIILVVKKNDTFDKIISPYVNNNKIKNKIIKTLNQEYDLTNLKIGQNFYLYQNNVNILKKIVVPKDFKNEIILDISNNDVVLSKIKTRLSQEVKSNKFIINSSLYEDGRKAKIPLMILSEVIKLFSFDVDFQRDIRKNNALEIAYEVFYNKERKSYAYGDIKYVKLIFEKNSLEYFMFLTKEGYIDYFNRDGKNVKKALMKTPIDGARLSSSFGLRKHPISGYNKLHKGVDFAAPKGTPIYAAGNGVIEFIGNNGGYGKYIRIRHNGSYKTAYAHLNNYNKNIYKGKRVNQGDTIGYVGSTGKSTGPHLHYEIIYLGKQINPMKMKLPPRKILEGKELKRFKKEIKNIYSDFLYSLYE